MWSLAWCAVTRNVDGIMPASFTVRQSKTIPPRFNHAAPCAVKRAESVDDIRLNRPIIRQSSAILARFGEA